MGAFVEQLAEVDLHLALHGLAVLEVPMADNEVSTLLAYPFQPDTVAVTYKMLIASSKEI